MYLFLTIGAVNKDIKSKGRLRTNHGHNILRLFDIWPNFLFTASETERNY